MNQVFLAGAARTPIGSFLGSLSSLTAVQLGAAALRGVLDRTRIDPALVGQVMMGNVLQAGVGQAPARQASLAAGIPESVGATTVHKVCGSGLRAVMDATTAIRAGEWDMLLAGGMESMSNAPHLLPRSRGGYRMGSVTLLDAMLVDGLWDPYDDKHMGNCGEICARKYELTRAAQDAFALESYQRARRAIEAGELEAELVPVSVPQRKGDPLTVAADEEPFSAPLDKMPKLRPAFEEGGTITAANSSKINDGAAAMLVCTEERAKALGLTPLARVVSQGSFAQAPDWFTTAPVGAARQALSRAGLTTANIDLWEINEAFAAVTMACTRELDIDPAKVNVRGGAVALGHPIGASGARILTTLLYALRDQKKRYGCAAICLGGGEGVAMVVESLT